MFEDGFGDVSGTEEFPPDARHPDEIVQEWMDRQNEMIRYTIGGTPGVVLRPRVYSYQCKGCKGEFQTHAKNRKPVCDDCRRNSTAEQRKEWKLEVKR